MNLCGGCKWAIDFQPSHRGRIYCFVYGEFVSPPQLCDYIKSGEPQVIKIAPALVDGVGNELRVTEGDSHGTSVSN